MLFAITILLSTVASLLSACAAEQWLHMRIPVIGGFAGLQLAHNPGIAFSITMPDSVEAVVILAALGLVTWLALRTAKTSSARIGFGMIIGGAIGNILDRIPDGLVTDYFQVGTFPIFNVADSFITIGVILLLLEEIWRYWRHHSNGEVRMANGE